MKIINLTYLIKANDEWTLFAYSKVDYSNLRRDDFLLTVKKYIVFQTKRNLRIINEDLDEINLLEKLNQKNILIQKENKNNVNRYNKKN